ncbi:threonine synthase [Zavarzinia compransoris]|uniref:threonine synthase n=1 Tax=Zavarzinia marina TaxID=2911065 RepID=UPI001F2D9C95|nr:threonine synthase [Zavarzinia marina]MCF4166536.1 threonine synthase [Zavarzinia marina]
MRYISTRGAAPALDFEGVLLAGLARDGGLYVPESWPAIADKLKGWRGLPYQAVAFEMLAPFVGDSLSPATLAELIDGAYGSFDHAAVCPLVQVGPNDFLLELFHGPTLAFKDVAMQLLGRLFNTVLTRRGEQVTVLGATSGDTGSAAIEALRGLPAVQVVMLHPKGRVSEVQRRQMTTVLDDNIHNIAIEGTFDDCQALVKALFNRLEFRDKARLSAVNSINWARIVAQTVYYVTSALSLGAPDRAVSFSVPTGNFGDIYAGYVARQMGLPVERLVVATNRNDILARALNAGDYSTGTVQPTISPSMDIQVSSNFERLLFDLYGRDGAVTAKAMAGFQESGRLALGANVLDQARALFAAVSVNEEMTRETMAMMLRATGLVVDPHSAVGLAGAAGARGDRSVPMVTLATAHPAKFPAAVEAATGIAPGLPPRMADLYERDERYAVLANDADALQAHMTAIIG